MYMFGVTTFGALTTSLIQPLLLILNLEVLIQFETTLLLCRLFLRRKTRLGKILTKTVINLEPNLSKVKLDDSKNIGASAETFE